MTRLIDADELQKALARMWYDSPISITGISVSALIDEQPTIEAEPVRRGRWLPYPTEKDWRVCSACGQGTEIVRHEAGATTEYSYKHCPWCGARMEREVDE